MSKTNERSIWAVKDEAQRDQRKLTRGVANVVNPTHKVFKTISVGDLLDGYVKHHRGCRG